MQVGNGEGLATTKDKVDTWAFLLHTLLLYCSLVGLGLQRTDEEADGGPTLPDDDEDPEEGQAKGEHLTWGMVGGSVGGVQLDGSNSHGYSGKEIVDEEGDDPVEALAEL